MGGQSYDASAEEAEAATSEGSEAGSESAEQE